MKTKQKLVVVGNGMAGMRTVEELLKRAPDAYDITVFGAEPHVNYNRIMLSSVLAGEKSLPDIVINDLAWYRDHGIRLVTGDSVVGIDAAARTVTAESGVTVPYDTLLLATGSKPIAPPIPGLNLPGVCAFRDIADVDTMIGASTKYRRAAVIGGGLLGLEAAYGLAKRGMAAAVVHLMPTLMERQLDVAAGHLLQRALDAKGLAFFTNAQTEEIYGTDRVEGLKLADGRDVPADLVVLAIGIRPNVALAKLAKLEANRGIMVGDDMRTSDPNIFAVGECAEHRGQTFGLVAPIWEMAKVCAEHLAGDSQAYYAGTVVSTRLKVTGIDMFSAGAINGDGDSDEITFHDAQAGIYKKLILRDDRVEGVVLYGDVADSAWYFQLLQDRSDVSAIRGRMIFGQAYADMKACGGAGLDVAAMADDAQVCGCNGVSKGAIVAAIQSKGLTTLDEVRAHTKASASCGQCSGTVVKILEATCGRAAVVSLDPPLCKCTDHGHDQIRHQILARSLKTIPDAMRALGWKTEDGCAKCRPALNYYLLCAWPAEYVDDDRSRFVNERLHANIQKDGTYSVVPRMWGGLTTPAELRAIADVADKFNIPTVKVTGGQRIDLFGVKKEQLPAVWADLNKAGMVSGHAYAKGLRTVKTCVGSEWCRFGTQDSTGLGVRLERMAWGMWSPHKFKLAVSGCPRNCAEASIKDFGVVCVEQGYELLVGGNGGIELRGTDKLAHVATEDEVLEYCGAFMQLYREEARYLDRTAPWIERVGIESVRQRIADDAKGRKALFARFLYSQTFAQVDPWAERTGDGVEAQDFQSLCSVE